MDSLSDILEDYTHGSTYLAKQYLELIVRKRPNKNELYAMKKKILDRFDDMQIFHYLHDRLEQSSDIPTAAGSLLKQLTASGKILADKLINRIGINATLLTISYSKAVVDTLNYLSYKIVYCMESQPGGEGKDLAADIDNGIMIEDDRVLSILEEIDAVIFGCDQYDDQFIVNKIGTKDLVEEIQAYEIPIFVLTSEFKYTSQVNKEISDPMLEVFRRELISEVITDKIDGND